MSASLFNANYAQYDERGFVRGTFQLQETDGSMPFSEDPGRETSCVYDILGNKVQETDDFGPQPGLELQHRRGQRRSTELHDQPPDQCNEYRCSGGSSHHTTAYTYTDFGQVRQETYTGTDITDPAAQNNRVYEYKDNGLLAQTTDHQTVGTPGSVGGLDYLVIHQHQ